MTYSGVLLNSGETGASLVDFVGVRNLPWAYTSDAMDGVFVDRDGSVWAAGAAGVGEQRLGYVYKYSPEGRVQARYLLGPDLFLASKLAADDRYLYFLAGQAGPGGQLEKRPCRLDRTMPPPGEGAQLVPTQDLVLRHWSLDQMAGHLYRGRLFLSTNGERPGEQPGKIVALDPATGAWEEVLTFPPSPDGKTGWVQMADVDPETGDIYLVRELKREGGSGVHGLGNTLSEAYNQQGARLASFVRMHYGPALAVNSWTPAGLFTSELVPDVRFGPVDEAFGDFVVNPRDWVMGTVNQVAVDGGHHVYAACGGSRSVMVFSARGGALARVGALAVRGLSPGPEGDLWLLYAEGGLAQGFPNTRSSEGVALVASPATARPETPPRQVGYSYADVSDLRGLAVTEAGGYYRLCRRNDQYRAVPYWEIRMGTSQGRPNAQAAVGKFPEGALEDPGGLCLAASPPGTPALLIPDAGKQQVWRLPLFTATADLAPVALAFQDREGRPMTLDRPRAVVADAQGNLILATARALYRFRPTTGEAYALEWQAQGFTSDEATAFSAVAVAGNEVFVADAGGHRVLHFDGEGRFLEQYGSPGQPGAERDRLNAPSALTAIGDYLYLADTGNLRVIRLKVR